MPDLGLRRDIWGAYGISILRAHQRLPPHLDWKIREVTRGSVKISPFFENDQPTETASFSGDFAVDVVEDFEAKLKEELAHQSIAMPSRLMTSQLMNDSADDKRQGHTIRNRLKGRLKSRP